MKTIHILNCWNLALYKAITKSASIKEKKNDWQVPVEKLPVLELR